MSEALGATRERWRALLARLAPHEADTGADDTGADDTGADDASADDASADALYDRLAAAYSAPGRHYHTLDHVSACLRALDAAAALARHADEVELALWLHDVVYDTHAHDNEARSAGRARELLERRGAGSHAGAVERLILATRHAGDPAGGDEALVRDIDLGVLAAPAEEFDAYERAIRREYAWVPEEEFRRRRAEILERFLAREHIYATPDFRARYERFARANLVRSVGALRPAG